MKMKFIFSAPASIIIIFRVSIDGSIDLNTIRLAEGMLHLRKCSSILVWILVIWTEVFVWFLVIWTEVFVWLYNVMFDIHCYLKSEVVKVIFISFLNCIVKYLVKT